MKQVVRSVRRGVGRAAAWGAEAFALGPEDVSSVLRAGPMMCAIACVNALVYAIVAAKEFPAQLVFAWLIISWAVFIAMFLNSERARARPSRSGAISARGRRRMMLYTMALAAPWAFAALVFFGSGDAQLDAVTPILCAGMAIAGAMICHRAAPIALTYFFTILLALCLAAIFRGLAIYWPHIAFSLALGPAVASSVLSTARAGRERDAMLIEVSTKNLALKAAQRKISRLAFECAVTGLPNRQALEERLERDVEAAERSGERLAFLLLDLDRFKNINDTLGHKVGDQLLKHIGEQLQTALGGAGFAARLGGDEFAVILPGAAQAHSVERLADRIRASIGEPVRLGGATLYPDTSIGIALLPDDAVTGADLMVCADIALHRAKEQGKGRVAIYHAGLAAAVSEADEIERDLREALRQRRLTLRYQPKIDVATGAVRGAEALLRWPRADGREIPPSVFLPVAEERGLILELTSFVFSQAAEDMPLFREATTAPTPIALNIHPVDLKAPQILLERLETLRRAGVTLDEIVFEITEGCFVGRGADAASLALDHLNEQGVVLSLDDFGTGHASLSHLKSLPVGEIKIDRSFVKGLCDEQSDRAIVSATIELARCMGMRSVAEGVETERQLALLRALGCDLAQGFLFAPAVDKHRFAAMLRAERVGPALKRA
ncbi:MAG: EAL domain-containing protein [Pseudomonadota bacterium]